MKVRIVIAALMLAGVTLGLTTSVPAQTPARKVFEVTATSFKFEPNQIQFNEGDTVVIRLRNIDPFGRPHNLSSAYLLDIPLTVRGDGREGTSEGRKWVAVDAGKAAEFEFVARGRGSYAFLCSLFTHAAQGQTGAFFVTAPGE